MLGTVEAGNATGDRQTARAWPAAADLDMGALLHFRSLMALDGHAVQVARMCYDRLYAYERIATAHGSAHDPLRRLALELFQTYHRRDELHDNGH
ncbi:MAG: hypothetical protein CFE46_04945 [Burkholderiales bacterium PBB6]|nr:MAG: hypothetical protein CFE46_04945 [Burkholderiales bacterium PBB6]